MARMVGCSVGVIVHSMWLRGWAYERTLMWLDKKRLKIGEITIPWGTPLQFRRDHCKWFCYSYCPWKWPLCDCHGGYEIGLSQKINVVKDSAKYLLKEEVPVDSMKWCCLCRMSVAGWIQPGALCRIGMVANFQIWEILWCNIRDFVV